MNLTFIRHPRHLWAGMRRLTGRRTVSLTVRGHVSPEEVWTRYTQPSRWTAWAPHLTRVTATTPVIQTGARGTVVSLGVLPLSYTVTDVTTDPMSWSWRVRCGPVRLELVHTVAPAGPRFPQGSATRVSITGPYPLVVSYLPLMWWALHRLVNRAHLGSPTAPESPRTPGQRRWE